VDAGGGAAAEGGVAAAWGLVEEGGGATVLPTFAVVNLAVGGLEEGDGALSIANLTAPVKGIAIEGALVGSAF